MTKPAKIDWVLFVLAVLLTATTLAFVLGPLPYPFGFIVLALLIFARLAQRRDGN